MKWLTRACSRFSGESVNPKKQNDHAGLTGSLSEQEHVTSEMVRAAVIGNDDFAFEIRVKALLEKHGASNVKHGWSYLDPVEEKPRQFDLRGELHHFRGTRVIQVAIECKNLDSAQPLVLSGTARTYEEAYHHYLTTDSRGCRVYEAGADTRGVFNQSKFVGRHITRLTRKGVVLEVSRREDEADIYRRWSQALASAVEPARDAVSTFSRQSAVLPIVVVPEGVLWQIFYDEAGDLQDKPIRVAESSIFVGHEIVLKPRNLWMKMSHVHFFTTAGLDRFLNVLTATTASWDEWFPTGAAQYTPPVH